MDLTRPVYETQEPCGMV